MRKYGESNGFIPPVTKYQVFHSGQFYWSKPTKPNKTTYFPYIWI